MTKLETMSDFFAARVEGYDEHMLTEVGGCREGYAEMARLVPENAHTLLDLGCGTGLELDGIFRVNPDISVVGIDMTREMLKKLSKKHSDKKLELICADYFAAELGEQRFDCAVSFQTMHHFGHEKKSELYTKIYNCLKSGGVYIECDYMAERQEDEDYFFAENERLRQEQGIGEGVLCHYDTPCTVANQIMLLNKAGFKKVEQVFKSGNTTMLTAKKEEGQ